VARGSRASLIVTLGFMLGAIATANLLAFLAGGAP
jgi:hypothetical protein